MRALGYIRVGALEQSDRDAERAAQRAALLAQAERSGWRLDVVSDAASLARNSPRPGLTGALQRLDDSQADVLIVSTLDRVVRRLADLGPLAQRARDRGWSLLSLDVGLDTATPAGQWVTAVVASTVPDDGGLVVQRTRDALAARRAAGARLGRPADVPADVVARVVAERRAGRSLLAIARGLDDDGVPTARGGQRWYPTTVAKLLQSQQARDL